MFEESISNIIINLYSNIFNDIDIDAVATKKTQLLLPQFSAEEIESLCRETLEIFKKEPVCLELDGPINLIGDLHGHILDLFRDLKTFGLPETTRYLFLGDIVDRGEFSIETVTLVFALKVKYPENVYIIRGNHEFEFLNDRCGFKEDVNKMYGQQTDLYATFKQVFSYMPITSVICQSIICVHGGLGPSWFSINQARKIERPIDDFGDDVLDAMLWSDPSDNIDYFEPSNRGTGFFFGESVVSDFLESNSLKLLVRAHECVNLGAQFMFKNQLVTVFGASNYCGLIANHSAVLCIKENGEYETKQFSPIHFLKRDAAVFQKVVNGKMVQSEPGKQRRIAPPSVRGIVRTSVPRIGALNRNQELKVFKPQQPSTARPRWSESSPRNRFPR
ncbi:Serine/threonine-protein phosphatase PP1-2 [Tritrichomonas foetus]|uniref:Serine/threonine-protein phosphatase n=1 Tax=Tritrichomonas foetus TaxID=1144522 RepID=A0A1J4KBI0_9EUKA|nr:Serine/threonine-protein phosphatase PP1-2 [Tritrichomonas foetus]|eukprot:OHT08579.1 Serine/threonine-protein phosphatase PP1-2 [Tritrichomonas foetus]